MRQVILAFCLLFAATLCLKVTAAPAFCSDGKTQCDGCQCCPDLKSCPSATNCPAGFSCPNDNQQGGGGQPTQQPQTGGGDADGVHDITFENRCPQDIWIGALGAHGQVTPQNGGWLMRKGDSPYILHLSTGWSGRFWGRTNCSTTSNGQFFCATGDCGRVFECKGAGGEPPVTLAEFTFDAHGTLDYYDVSLVDGYNLPVLIEPIKGTYVDGVGICEPAGCNQDLNQFCPTELRQIYGGQTVACKSACAAFDEPRYCCRDEYDCTPHAESCPPGKKPCDPATWPVNYAAIFKTACPTSYSFAYDDPSSTFTCRGNPRVDYNIIFCP